MPCVTAPLRLAAWTTRAAVLRDAGGIAEFETELRKARQAGGTAAAKVKGPASPFKGRPTSVNAIKVKALRDEGLTPTAIGKRLGIARSSVYRLLGKGEEVV